MIYFDHFATTPCAEEVIAAMTPYLREQFGNSGSSYLLGRQARDAVEEARASLAELLEVPHRSLCFTSGATEANNLLIQGLSARHPELLIISQCSEHPAVLEPLQRFERSGGRLRLLPIDGHGLVDPVAVEIALKERRGPALVCLMRVNNELGVIQPVEEVGMICREAGAWLHVDGAQAIGKIPCMPRALGASSFALSAHKFYGPKGIGALFLERSLEAALEPLFLGGGQERGLRPGTAPVHQIVALGAAAALARQTLDAGEGERLNALRMKLFAGLRAALPSLQESGGEAPRVSGGANFFCAPSDAERLDNAWRGRVAFSQGAACASGHGAPSATLLAIGRSAEEAHYSFRVCLGRESNAAEVEEALRLLG